MRKTEDFLIRHRLRASDFDMDDLVSIFTEDMIAGLLGQDGTMRMIPTYIEADNDFLRDMPVLAIDAGGTNFRAALVSFKGNGEIRISDDVQYQMPGLDKEVSAEEFFNTIAGYIRDLAEKTERIGFCFSYPTEILPDRDGRLIQFCKEVKAPGVVGQLIGKRLLESLGSPSKKIVLLNDTVATLLAGKSASLSRSYDSFIGFILGTGTNTCYIEKNSDILKKADLDQMGSMIINIESGNFGKAPRSDLDMFFDNCTFDPGNYTFEKMISGGYFGGLSLSVLKAAADEGVFSADTIRNIAYLHELSTGEVNEFAAKGEHAGNILSICFHGSEDIENANRIVDNLIDRAAKLVASSLASVVLKTGKGKSAEKPVLITVEGTTFYRLHRLRPRFEEYFHGYLNGDRKRFVEFTGIQQSSLIGAALAALIE
jgi:hexokinase